MEKGILELDVFFKDGEVSGEVVFCLFSVELGECYNMVLDYVIVILEDVKDFDKLVNVFKIFLVNYLVEGILEENGKFVKINIVGKFVYVMELNNGVNVGFYLVVFFGKFKLIGVVNDFVIFGCDYLFGDFCVVKLGISYEDEESGELIMNVGVICYDVVEGGKYGFNFCYLVIVNMDKLKNKM